MKRLGFIYCALAVPFLMVLNSTAASSELEFNSNVPGASIKIAGPQEVRGLAPLRVPGPLEGGFWVTAQGNNHETQRGFLRVKLDESGSRIASYARPGMRESLLRGMLFPGYAQWRSQDRGKGWFMTGVAATSVAFTLWSQAALWDADSELDRRRAEAGSSALAGDELFEAQTAVRNAIEQKNFAENRRNLLLTASIAAWGIHLVDALLLKPDFRVSQVSSGSMMLQLKPRSGSQAALRSALFPGLGQLYNGQTEKAVWVALGGVASAAYLIHERNDYNDTLKERDQARRAVANARNATERASAEVARDAANEELDNRNRDRTLALGVTVGFWAVSIVDAVLSTNEDEVASTRRVSLGVDPRERALAARLRF